MEQYMDGARLPPSAEQAVRLWHLVRSGLVPDPAALEEYGVFWVEEPFAPYTSMSGINSATLALLATCSNALIYGADLSALNPFRDELVRPRATIGRTAASNR